MNDKKWVLNSDRPITKEHQGKTLLIRFYSDHIGISHTDEESGDDWAIDISYLRVNDYSIIATTGTYTNDHIHSWKEI